MIFSCHYYSKKLQTNMATTIATGNPMPAMCHVVCTLVATGIAGINITNSVPVTTKTAPTQPAPLPEGYSVYPDIGFAYKVHDEQVSWREAKKRCIREGARLALTDSTKKLEYLKSQKKSDNNAHVGIVRMYDSTWVDGSTGNELGALPWLSGYPGASQYDCVRVQFSTSKVYNNDCGVTMNYVCEIPITVFVNNGMSVN